MSAPEKVRLKRKRNEELPESLVLTRAQGVGQDTLRGRIRYIREQAEDDTTRSPSKRARKGAFVSAITRTFHLKKRKSPDNAEQAPTKRHRDDTYNLPIFEEDHFRAARAAAEVNSHTTDTPSPPPKRPGRGSALRNGQGTTRIGTPTDVQALADSMHQFALDELSKIPRPASKTKPRMSPAQSQSRHARSVASNSSSPASSTSAMDIDDSDFVYDTYVLTSNAEDIPKDDVGYLVIHDDDDEYWQSLLEQAETEEDEIDEEDENAEDHYAADYPEDELASDDEYDHNAYSFRPRAGSDVEQWDHRDSSDEEEEEPFSMRSTTVKKWEQELGIASRAQN